MCNCKTCKCEEHSTNISRLIDSLDVDMGNADFIRTKNLIFVSLDKISGCKSKKNKRATSR